MAVMTITIPDPVATEVIDALAAEGGWRSVPLDGAKDAFAKQVVIGMMKRIANNHKIRQASTAVVPTDLTGIT